MILYLAIAFVLLLLALSRLCGWLERRYEIGVVLCLTIIAYLWSFLRWETGTDWDSYISMYRDITSLAHVREQSWWGPAYSYTALLAHQFNWGYSTFLFGMATILFGVKFSVLHKTCAAPLVAVFVLFCANFYDIYFVRQSLAAVFFWAFVYYYYNKRYWLAVISAAFAVVFHYSAALPIGIAIAFSHLNWRSAALLLALAVGVAYAFLLFYTVDEIVQMATALVQDIVTGEKSPFGSAVNAYVGSEYVEEKASELSTTLRSYIKLAFWLFVVACSYFWFIKRSVSERHEDWSAFCLRCAAGIILVSAALLPVSEIFSRVPSYALPLFAVVLSNFDFRLRRLSLVSSLYVVVTMLLFVQLAFLYYSYEGAYYPVKWVFT